MFYVFKRLVRHDLSLYSIHALCTESITKSFDDNINNQQSVNNLLCYKLHGRVRVQYTLQQTRIFFCVLKSNIYKVSLVYAIQTNKVNALSSTSSLRFGCHVLKNYSKHDHVQIKRTKLIISSIQKGIRKVFYSRISYFLLYRHFRSRRVALVIFSFTSNQTGCYKQYYICILFLPCVYFCNLNKSYRYVLS